METHAQRCDQDRTGSRAGARDAACDRTGRCCDRASRWSASCTRWSNVSPCNLNLRDLAQRRCEGVRAAGGTPIEFNTIAVTDGIAMGTPGMRASLVSREVITDSIELAVDGHCLDAMVVLCGCDKTIPAAAMALARLDIPGVALYGGSIAHGTLNGHPITIQRRVRGRRCARRRQASTMPNS